jgi:hypothetical protein
LHCLLGRPRGVIGHEPERNASLVEEGDEILRRGEGRVAAIEHAVQVDQEMAYAAEVDGHGSF